MVYLILLEYDEDKLVDLWEHDQMSFFIARIIRTIEHDETTVYIIVDTDLFTEIPASTHGLTGYVTDILITDDIIFFAQGDHIPVRKLKWSGGSWMSMADEYSHVVNGTSVTIQNCAMYLQTVRDTSGLVLWRANNNDDNKPDLRDPAWSLQIV